MKILVSCHCATGDRSAFTDYELSVERDRVSSALIAEVRAEIKELECCDEVVIINVLPLDES